MTLSFTSLNGDLFLFNANNITEILFQICEYIDNYLLVPEDLIKFVNYVKENLAPNLLLEINAALNKGTIA